MKVLMYIVDHITVFMFILIRCFSWYHCQVCVCLSLEHNAREQDMYSGDIVMLSST